MTVDQYEGLMRQGLLNAGFDFNVPNAAVAWEVFKKLSPEPVESEDSYLFWEASCDYFDFVREFRHYPENGAVWHEQLTIHFTCASLGNLEIDPVAVFSRNYTQYQEFFEIVENRPDFIKGLAFKEWSVELRLDGC